MSRQPRRRGPSILFLVLLLALVVSAGILIMGEGPDTGFGMAKDDFARLAFLVVVLVFVASGLIGHVHGPGEIFRSVVGWVTIFLVAVGIYSYRVELAGVGGRILSALAPGVPISGPLAGTGDNGTVVVVRAPDGHFAVRGTVDDRLVVFLVDTGASFVTLTYDDAKSVGINADALDYVTPIRTANGRMSAARIVLDRIDIGSITRRQVRALVAPDKALDQSLLGMTFLDTLAGYAISGDRLIMKP